MLNTVSYESTAGTVRMKRTQSVPAVEKVFSILEVLAHSNTGLTLKELATACGVPKSSVHCIMITLQRRGYLHRNGRTSRYLFGRKLLTLANYALSGLDLRERAEPYMRDLAQRTGLRVHLGIIECDEAVIVAKFERALGARPIGSWIGKRMDLHCTALGKALISQWSEEELTRFVRERSLSRHNDNTIWTLQKLIEDLKKVRQLGFAVDDEEDVLGLRCIGAPVFGDDGTPIAAFSVSGTTIDITGENVEAIASHVKKAANGFSRFLLTHAPSEQPV